MTTEHEATRTLVKSPPELWAECSDPDSLARHLSDAFGEIRITRLEPENAVAWEGDRASGTVWIEPSAWGTRVTLTAQTAVEEVDEEPAEVAETVHAPEAEPPPVIDHEPEVEDDAVVAEEPVLAQEMVVDEEDAPVLAPEPEAKLGVIARLRAWFRPAPKAVAETPAEPLDEPEALVEDQPEVVADEPEAAVAEPAPPAAEATPPPTVEAAAAEPAIDAEAALTAALDSLGQAHHRPFSRA